MKKIYRTALGKTLDFDAIRENNDQVIAVGNHKVNARGDELGPGGKIIRTRDQVMRDYYALKTPIAADPPPETLPTTPVSTPVAEEPSPPVITDNSGLTEDDMAVEEVAVEPHTTLRGSFAGSVAKSVTINQTPLPNPKKAKGVQRF